MTYICVSKLTIIGLYNGLLLGRRTNARILLFGPLGTNFSEILIEMHTYTFRKMPLQMSLAICRPFCLDLNMLKSNTFARTSVHVSKTNAVARAELRSPSLLCDCYPSLSVNASINLCETSQIHKKSTKDLAFG